MAKLNHDEQISKWSKRYSKALENQRPIFEKFSKYFDQLYASINAEGMADWRSRVFIPILNEKAWQIISKITLGKSGWVVLPKDEVWQENAVKQENLLKYQFTNPEFDKPMFVKQAEVLIDAVATGTGFAKIPWVFKDKKTYQKVMNEDGTIDHSTWKETTTKMGYNDFVPVNVYDVLTAPGAKSIQGAAWAIIKGRATIDSLKEEFADNTEVVDYLEKYETASKTTDDTEEYKKSRTNYYEEYNITDNSVDEVELWECFDKHTGMITYILDKNNYLTSKPNTYWHGKIPIVVFNLKPKAGSIFGEGIFEVSYRLQHAVNDLFNHFMDSWNLSVDGMLMLDEGSEVEDFITSPGGVFHYQGNKPDQFKFSEPNPTTFTMVQNVIRNALDGVTISPYITGMPNDNADKTQGTATGIIRIQEAASDLLGFFRYMVKSSMKEVGFMWMMNNIEYVDRDQKIIIEDGIRKFPDTVKPVDLTGEFELDIDMAVLEPTNKEAMRQVYLDYLTQLKDLVVLSQRTQTPFNINYEHAAKVLSDKFGIAEYEKILASPPMSGMPPETMMEMMQMQQGGQGGQEGQEGMPQNMPQGMPQGMPGGMPEMDFPMPDKFKNDVVDTETPNTPERNGFLNKLIKYVRR